ncbi:MAG: glycosyltransferase family 4 protein [Allomuricauda sp.]
MKKKKKIIRITTIPGSLGVLLDGQLKFMSQFYEIIGISSAGTPPFSLDDVAKKEEVKVIPVEMSRRITFLKDIAGVFKLGYIFIKERPDIVHTHTPKAGLLGMLAAYITRVPLRMHTVAGMPLLETTGSKRRLLDLIEKLTYFCATHVYPNSFGLKEIIIKNHYAPESKIKVIGHGSSNGIDTSFFDPQIYSAADRETLSNSIGVPNGDFVFSFVGRLVKDKGINELIEAFKKICSTHSNISLVLVGGSEPELDPLLPETVAEIESNKKIFTVGWQKDVRPFLAISNAFVFPSYREGFPNSVLQASSMGLPCIVSDINGCNEIIQHEGNGLIVPPKNTDALFEGMVSLINGNQAIQLDSDQIRKQIKDQYERKVIMTKILEEYRSLLSQ